MSDLPAARARVMTWNIWWRFGPRWQDRQHGLVETLRAVDADVVALQEVWGTAETTQAHEFAGQLGRHAAVVAACLEYEPAYNDDRIAQAHALVELATDPAVDGPLPVIVAGDLNAAPDSPVLRSLHDVLIDAWSAGAGDPTAVTLPSTHPSAPVEAAELIDQRIDHVFLGPGQLRQRVVVESAGLAGAPVAGLDPSAQGGSRLRPELDRCDLTRFLGGTLSARRGLVGVSLGVSPPASTSQDSGDLAGFGT